MTVAARLHANGNFISSNFDEYNGITSFRANTSGVHYVLFDEITSSTVPLRQLSDRLVANGVFDEVTSLLSAASSATFVNGTFQSTNSTSPANINIPSGANSSSTLYLWVVYENNYTGVNSLSISGFTRLYSNNGASTTFTTFGTGGPTSSVVLFKGSTSNSVVTIPNDASFNGFAAVMVAFNNVNNETIDDIVGGTNAVQNYNFTKNANDKLVFLSGNDMGSAGETAITVDSDFTSSGTHSAATTPASAGGRGSMFGVVEGSSTSGTISIDAADQNGYYGVFFRVS